MSKKPAKKNAKAPARVSDLLRLPTGPALEAQPDFDVDEEKARLTEPSSTP